jgi:hypothetical protein
MATQLDADTTLSRATFASSAKPRMTLCDALEKRNLQLRSAEPGLLSKISFPWRQPIENTKGDIRKKNLENKFFHSLANR